MVKVGIAPFGVVISKDARIAYVSNWGGRIPTSADKTAPTGRAADADQVVIDDRGIASTGTISRIDLTTLQTTQTIAVGLHPTGLSWDETSAIASTFRTETAILFRRSTLHKSNVVQNVRHPSLRDISD